MNATLGSSVRFSGLSTYKHRKKQKVSGDVSKMKIRIRALVRENKKRQWYVRYRDLDITMHDDDENGYSNTSVSLLPVSIGVDRLWLVWMASRSSGGACLLFAVYPPSVLVASGYDRNRTKSSHRGALDKENVLQADYCHGNWRGWGMADGRRAAAAALVCFFDAANNHVKPAIVWPGRWKRSSSSMLFFASVTAKPREPRQAMHSVR